MGDQYNSSYEAAGGHDSVSTPAAGGAAEYGNENDQHGSYGQGGGFGGDRGGGDSTGNGAMTTRKDTIFITGMNPKTTEEEICQHFGAIGIIKTDKRTQKPCVWKQKGEATVTYIDPEAVSTAIQWFDGREFNGKIVKVSSARRQNN